MTCSTTHGPLLDLVAPRLGTPGKALQATLLALLLPVMLASLNAPFPVTALQARAFALASTVNVMRTVYVCTPPAASDTSLALICIAVLFTGVVTRLGFSEPVSVVTVQPLSATPVAGKPGVSDKVYTPGTPPVLDTVTTYSAWY